jgi:S1-C subfamily serine protease
VTALDWIIVALALGFALFGYAQGFIVGALSLIGFALGAVLGTRIGPALLPQHSHSPYAPLFGLAGALFAGAILAAGFEGLGARLRRRVRIPALGVIDGLMGALLTACIALGIAWIGSAVALQAPGASSLRRDIQRSAILRALNQALPPSGPILHALARFDPLPTVSGPVADVPRPDPATARIPAVRRAGASVVRVLGTACGLGVEGSGWVAAPGVVVTNAHVVAGEDDTSVQAGGAGQHLTARVLAFDPRNDIAVLRVAGLGAPSLPIVERPRSGSSAAILGFPLNGPFDVEAGRIGSEQTILTEDAYGRGPLPRAIVPLRGLVRSGNSGGPLVDVRGRVLGTVFAATSARRRHAGFAVPNRLARRALAMAAGGRQVSTGPCAE